MSTSPAPALESSPPAAAEVAMAAPRRTNALRSNLGWNAMSDLAARGASLWVSFFGARQLSVEDFGRFTFALAIVQYVWLAGDATANSGYATRELARRRAAKVVPLRGVAQPFWLARLGAAAVLTAAVLAASAWLPIAPALAPVLAASSAYLLAYAAYPDWALRGLEDFRGLCAANVAYAVALVVSTAVILPRTHSPAHAALAWSASFAVAAAVAVPRLMARGALGGAAMAPEAGWRAHARRSLVFSFGAIAGIGSVQTPLLLAGMLATPHEAGLFAAAFRLLLAALGVYSVLWWPLFPLLARLAPGSREHGETVADAAALVIAIGLPPAIGATLFATPLLTQLFGAEYAGAAAALRIGAWALPLYALCGLLEQVALAANGEVLRLRVYGAATLTIMLVGSFAIRAFGAVGAAVALLAGFVLAAAAWGTALQGVLPWRLAARRATPLALASAGLAGVWLVLARTGTLPPLVSLAGGAAAYAALVLGLRLVPFLGRAKAGA